MAGFHYSMLAATCELTFLAVNFKITCHQRHLVTTTTILTLKTWNVLWNCLCISWLTHQWEELWTKQRFEKKFEKSDSSLRYTLRNQKRRAQLGTTQGAWEKQLLFVSNFKENDRSRETLRKTNKLIMWAWLFQRTMCQDEAGSHTQICTNCLLLKAPVCSPKRLSLLHKLQNT
jgi:hypothetical protein